MIINSTLTANLIMFLTDIAQGKIPTPEDAQELLRRLNETRIQPQPIRPYQIDRSNSS